MNSHRGWGRVQRRRSGLGQLLAQPERLAGVTAVHVNFPAELRSRQRGRTAAALENFIARVPGAS